MIGAHAQGFNTGSVGVALLGTYSAAAPSAAAQAALVRLLAWRLDLAHVDPLVEGDVPLRAATPSTARACPFRCASISGHRDTGYTSCPGDRAYALLPQIAARVAATGLPKLYAPKVQTAPDGLVRFTGAALGRAAVAA